MSENLEIDWNFIWACGQDFDYLYMRKVADQLHPKENDAQSWPITCIVAVQGQYPLSRLNERLSTVQMLMN